MKNDVFPEVVKIEFCILKENFLKLEELAEESYVSTIALVTSLVEDFVSNTKLEDV